MSMAMAVDTAAAPRWPRIATFGIVLAVHAVLIAGMCSILPAPRTPPAPVAMTVHMVEIPVIQPSRPLPMGKPAVSVAPHRGAPARAATSHMAQVPHPAATVAPAASHAGPVPQAQAALSSLPAPQAESSSAESTSRHDSPASFDADYLHNPAPAYPAAARRAGEQGRVLLLVKVSPQGLAEQVELRQGSGFARLDEAAKAAVSQWRFVPARRGDEPVAANVIVPITFRLGR